MRDRSGRRRLGLATWAVLPALLLVTLAGCGPPANAPSSTRSTPETQAGSAAPAPQQSATEVLVPPADDLDTAYHHITPQQLVEMLREKDFYLINTHTPYGYEIAGTDASIPLDPAGHWRNLYPADRSAKIVLYCRSGRWSVLTARQLVLAGYDNIWHLDGGMVAWYHAGLPLVWQ